MKCKTCSHPQRQAIDQALLTRSQTLEALSSQYGLGVSSLFRHKQHLVENLDQARDRLRNSLQVGQYLKLNAALESVQRAVDAAEADGNIDRVIRGAGVSARIINQMSRMEIPLNLDTVYRIISSPQWVSQDSILPADPRVLIGLHQTITDIALSPCPDSKPEEFPETTNAAPLETRNSKLQIAAPDSDDDDNACEAPETIPAAGDRKPATVYSQLKTQNPELLQHLLNRLSLTETDILEKISKNKREKSAKLPIKSSFRADNNKQYQSDNQYEKTFAKNPAIKPNGDRHQQPETEN